MPDEFAPGLPDLRAPDPPPGPEDEFVPGRTYFQPIPVKGVDPATFVILNALYARDARMVFYRYGKVPTADPASFRVLDPGYYLWEDEDHAEDRKGTPGRCFQGYARDDRAIFHYVDTVGKPSEVRGADLDTFEILRWGFARDRSRVYYERARLKGVVPEAFAQINRYYSTTGSAIYYLERPLIGADPATFQVLRGMLARDARCVYLYERIILDADPDTYQPVGYFFIGKDKSRAYVHGEPIEGADPETFESAGGGYQRDRDRVYYQGKPIPKADPKSFRFIHDNWGEDDHRVYQSGYPARRLPYKFSQSRPSPTSPEGS